MLQENPGLLTGQKNIWYFKFISETPSITLRTEGMECAFI